MSSRGLSIDRRLTPGKPGTGTTRGCHRDRRTRSGKPDVARADVSPPVLTVPCADTRSR